MSSFNIEIKTDFLKEKKYAEFTYKGNIFGFAGYEGLNSMNAEEMLKFICSLLNESEVIVRKDMKKSN